MRRRLAVAAVAAAATMAAGAVAWACTAISAVHSINPDAAPAGTIVEVTGRDFWPQPVEIRWNSADGAVIGTARGPEFVAQAKIPDVAPGHYRVFAIQPGSLNPHISFRVTAANAGGDDQGQHQASGGEGSGPAESFEDQPWQPQAQGESSSASPSSSSSQAGGDGTTASKPSSPSPPRPGSDRTGPPSANGPANPAPGPSTAAASSELGPVPAPLAAHDPPSAGFASGRVASGEVGFDSPWPRSSPAGTSLAQNTSQGGSAGSGLAAGVVFMAVGLAGLGAATAMAARRRRPARSTSHHQISL